MSKLPQRYKYIAIHELIWLKYGTLKIIPKGEFLILLTNRIS